MPVDMDICMHPSASWATHSLLQGMVNPFWVAFAYPLVMKAYMKLWAIGNAGEEGVLSAL